MTWLHFSFWLLAAYGGYYAALLGWELLRSRRASPEKGIPILQFAEPLNIIQPPAADMDGPVAPPPVTGTGGVLLSQIFPLSRGEAFEYTRGVSF